MKRNRRKNKKKNIVIVLLIIIILAISLMYLFYLKQGEERKIRLLTEKDILIKEINSHYNEYVKTNKESKIYKLVEDNYIESGIISKDIELTLIEDTITENTVYFQIDNLSEYYINYNDVNKVEIKQENDTRYLNYIPYNQNIVTKEETSFYDDKDNLLYKFKKSFSLPIIIKDNDKYGISFDNKLLYVKSDDIKDIIENHNTDKTNSNGVAVLNYHAFYDENNKEEASKCQTSICHSLKQFTTQLDYIKEINMFTPTMWELEQYIDGKLQLPKSVVITIDDGPKSEHAVRILDEYKMNATIFLISGWFDGYNLSEYFNSEYIELHSHTHNMHDVGICPGGQGSAIKCLAEDKIQSDLKASREVLNNTTVFCFPFYEYNYYAIEMVKKAGFTMAFIGGYGDDLVHVGDNKYTLRRFVIVTYTTMLDLENYFNQIR